MLTDQPAGKTCFFTVLLSLFKHHVDSMLRLDPNCDEGRPVKTEFDGADQGIYSVKLTYNLSLSINFKMQWSRVSPRNAAEDLAMWSFKECKLIV